MKGGHLRKKTKNILNSFHVQSFFELTQNEVISSNKLLKYTFFQSKIFSARIFSIHLLLYTDAIFYDYNSRKAQLYMKRKYTNTQFLSLSSAASPQTL